MQNATKRAFQTLNLNSEARSSKKSQGRGNEPYPKKNWKAKGKKLVGKGNT